MHRTFGNCFWLCSTKSQNCGKVASITKSTEKENSYSLLENIIIIPHAVFSENVYAVGLALFKLTSIKTILYKNQETLLLLFDLRQPTRNTKGCMC